MATLIELQAQLDALQSARSAGVRQVSYADGRNITYRSLAEIDRIISDLETAIAGIGVGSVPPSVRRVKLSMSKGV